MPWFLVTMAVTLIYMCLTILVMFSRPDFINLTISLVSLLILLDPERITKSSFRYLVFAIIGSFAYDVIWLVSASAEY